mmetsp:Transcript_10550/g.20640  ORF Transcript_10550/g.20640 Transcript_10550/m.20640 type:complete len:90 (-) Transcript_10550:716-985(-)
MTQIMEYLKRITPKDDMLPMQISIRIIRKQIKEKVYAQAEAALKKLEDVLKADKKVVRSFSVFYCLFAIVYSEDKKMGWFSRLESIRHR